MSKLINKQPTTISEWENGKNIPRSSTLYQLADLEKRKKDLEERQAKLEEEFKKMKKDIHILSNNPLLSPKDDTKCQIPTFKILLPNVPIENQEDNILGYINVASNGNDYKNYFAMSVIKNSLEPRLQVGDIMIVRKASKTQIKNGDLVVFSAKEKRKLKLM